MNRKNSDRRVPDWVAPQLATLAGAAPDGDQWLHEIKYDGFRILAWLESGSVRLLTRNRKDWTGRFPSIVEDLGDTGIRDAILDGEVVVELPGGVTSFQLLQNTLRDPSAGELRFMVFDVLFLEGEDLRPVPLTERKRRLAARLSGRNGQVRYSDHVEDDGPSFHRRACEHGLEGIISKRATAPYRSGRGRDWLKVKCVREQEFVVGGHTAPGGSRDGLGALHLGTWDDDGTLRYRGKVGTGFTDATLRDLTGRLEALGRGDSPFTDGPRGAAARTTSWVEPELVVQIRYSEITSDGRLRHPVYLGLRDDRDAREVRLEAAAEMTTTSQPASRTAGKGPAPEAGPSTGPAGVRLTSPEKVLFPEIGVTKLELARYYEAIAEWILPHIRLRPLTLVRCPAGHDAHCFFQKHFDGKTVPAALSLVEVEERDGPALYGALDSTAGLVSLVQLGALELHTWNAKSDMLERPDRFIIDLDPDPSVEWDAVIDGALHVRDLLLEIGLESFLKTTGGKGLHVVVPLVRRSGWDEVREFSRGVASLLAAAAPTLYTLEMSLKKRRGRILLDYLRNARGATAVEAYSTRAKAGAPVAAPIHWDELADGVRADSFNVRNMAERMASLREDPWKDIGAVKQSITASMKRKLGR